MDNFLTKSRTCKPNIACIGDTIIDEFYNIHVSRISPEFPVSIMHSEDDIPISRLGGASLVGYNLKHFNVCVKLVSFLDIKALKIVEKYLSCEYSELVDTPIPRKKRFMDNGIQIKRWDVEKRLCQSTQPILSQYCQLAPVADVAILSDYDKGFFTNNTRDWISVLNKRGTKTIVDPKNQPIDRWKNCFVFKPNLKEARELSGLSDHKDQCLYFKEKLNCKHVIITKSGEGVVVDGDEILAKDKIQAQSVIGGGDSFSAILGLAIAYDLNIKEAVMAAFEAGRIYVQNKLNRPITPAELSKTKIISPVDLQSRDFSLVFCNGCLDMGLTIGHVKTIQYAKNRGDKLVVALNDDASVSRLKGIRRPIMPLAERMGVVSALKDVDFVTSFSEDTPLEIMKIIKPDLIVKGGDYKAENVIGYGIFPVEIATYVQGISTTDKINALGY